MSPFAPLGFLITGLACWRAVVFIRQDKLIDGTRRKLTIFLARKNSLVRRKLAYFIDCPWCLGVWFAGIAVLAWHFSGEAAVEPVSGVLLWLGLSVLPPLLDQLSDLLGAAYDRLEDE